MQHPIPFVSAPSSRTLPSRDAGTGVCRALAVVLASLGFLAFLAQGQVAAPSGGGRPPAVSGWARHTVDGSSQGADGVRLDDWNGDGLTDIVTAWEEGGTIRVYLHPGHGQVRSPWPSVTVGSVESPEDAVAADLDGDGSLDVLSSAEGRTRALFVHWAPSRGEREVSPKLLDPQAWQTGRFPQAPIQQWMFALSHNIDQLRGLDFFAGGKGEGASVGWFESPENPRQLNRWVWHHLREVGWLMSLIATDMDGDGDQDLLLTDRKGPMRGATWLENPGKSGVRDAWREHPIGEIGEDEVMFLTEGDIDADGLRDIIVATKPQHLAIYRRLDTNGAFAAPTRVPFPPNTGTAKGVAVGDIDGDGLPDLVFSCEHAAGEKRGVMALLGGARGKARFTEALDISGPDGTKFDLVQLVDLDGDGDLDVLTCEETENLGVIWYENPSR